MSHAQNANGDAMSVASGVSRASSRLQREYIMIGFVGYPNVGKSSTINALLGRKRVGVTSTPGKTKHFQTLIVSDSVMLCDCPGLVFPSVVSSRAEMVSCRLLVPIRSKLLSSSAIIWPCVTVMCLKDDYTCIDVQRALSSAVMLQAVKSQALRAGDLTDMHACQLV